MADKKYYWIKLKTDFFGQAAIDFLLSQKNGCEYIVLYQMLCLLTANSNGQLVTEIGEMIIPYNAEKIVRDTKYFDFDTVKVAMEMFCKLGLIYESEDNGFLKISGYENMVGCETQYAEKMRKYREKYGQKRLREHNEASYNVACNVREENREKRTDIRDKDIDIDKEKDSADTFHLSPSEIIEIFSEICKSYAKPKALSDSTRADIENLTGKYTEKDIREVFGKAETSAFLKGKNNRNWIASFEWIIREKNFCKVLNGNYNEKGDSDMDKYYQVVNVFD